MRNASARENHPTREKATRPAACRKQRACSQAVIRTGSTITEPGLSVLRVWWNVRGACARLENEANTFLAHFIEWTINDGGREEATVEGFAPI